MMTAEEILLWLGEHECQLIFTPDRADSAGRVQLYVRHKDQLLVCSNFFSTQASWNGGSAAKSLHSGAQLSKIGLLPILTEIIQEVNQSIE